GDVVLTTPLLEALAARHGPVDVVTTPAAAALLETHPAVRRVIPYDKKGRDAGPGGLVRLARRLRAERYAVASLPHRSLRTAVEGDGGRRRAVNACGRLTLRQSAEAIRRAALLATNDSAPLHLAQAVGTPTVAIFGPTVPAFGFGPRGPRDRVVELNGLICRP